MDPHSDCSLPSTSSAPAAPTRFPHASSSSHTSTARDTSLRLLSACPPPPQIDRPSRTLCRHRPSTAVSWRIGLRLLLMTTLLMLGIGPVAADLLASRDRDLLQRVMLKKFGLEELTQDRRLRETQNSHAPMPLYIWDFYEQANDGEYELVRHYLPRFVRHHDQPTTTGWFLLYNLTATGRRPEKELVVKADLRLHVGQKMPNAEEYARREIIRSSEQLEADLVTTPWEKVSVFEVDPSFPELHRLLDTRYLPEDRLRRGEKWVDFDVTGALARRRPQDNNDLVELYIERTAPDRGVAHIDLRESAALIVQLEKTDGSLRPKRRKRSLRNKSGRRRKGHDSVPQARNLCRRDSLWVDFKALHWDDWIISPLSYEAYQCRGKCTEHTPSARQNYTNHAIMQKIIHELNATTVPPPCCVPTELSSLALLYHDVHNTTVVQKYSDMIVDACGCH